jgi:hypothetical protein
MTNGMLAEALRALASFNIQKAVRLWGVDIIGALQAT